MSSGLYSHTTRGVGTVLTAAIYNSDHVNHITNHNPQQMGGYSDSVGEMQLMTDPGSLGSEVLAANMAAEIAALRFVIARITGETHWYEAPVTSLGTIGGGIPLVLAFAALPLTVRRTENDTNEREIISHQSGSGVGNKYTKRIVGSGANAVAEVREYIGAVEMMRRTATLITHQIATHLNSYLGVGAAGVDLVKIDPAGFFDVKKIETPANPAADHIRVYVKDIGAGVLRLTARNSEGSELSLTAAPDPGLDDVRLGTVATGSNPAPAGNVVVGASTSINFDTNEVSSTVSYKPLQKRTAGGSYVTVSG